MEQTISATVSELPSYGRLPLDVVGAEGDELILGDGRRLLDLYGGHCVNLLGAGDAQLGSLLHAQWKKLSFATNLLPLEGRAAYAAALAQTLPPGQWQYFLSNSGAEANENAIKLALDATGRDTILCFSGAFHGRTSGAAALNDGLETGFPLAPYRVRRVAWGDKEAALKAIDSAVAGVILEPIQSMAGVVTPPPQFLEALRGACNTAGAVLIFDEVQSGSGRLGSAWGSTHFGVIPDVFSSAKGVGGGFPMGLTVVSQATAQQVNPKLFGSTFGGGPMALCAATEVARRIQSAGFLETVRSRSRAFRELCQTGPVEHVRGAGLLLGLELQKGFSASQVRDQLLDARILVGTSADPQVLRISPPLTVSESAPLRLAQALESIATD